MLPTHSRKFEKQLKHQNYHQEVVSSFLFPIKELGIIIYSKVLFWVKVVAVRLCFHV